MSESPYNTPESTLNEEHDFDLMEVAIGDNNTNYYIRYLENAGEDSWTPSWHWPAFFVTSGWLLYRKLWLAWFLYFFALPVALIFAGVITVALGETFGAIAQTVISLVCYFVLMPMFANALYARKLRRLVATAAVHSDNREKRIQWLATHGGTSLIWMVVLIFPVVIGILAAVALPAYQDYIISSNTAKVISHYEESARYVENELGKVKSSIVMGTETLANFQATRDSAQWVADLNLEGLIAPGGGPAFATTVDHQVGIVGVVATGSVMDDPITYQVTITRPAYGDFSEQPVAARVVHWVDI